MHKFSQTPTGSVTPLLAQSAVRRSGDARIPGGYSASHQLWMMEDAPLVSSVDGLPELRTKTEAQMERDDVVPNVLLEMATKTDAVSERDDQSPWSSIQRMRRVD
jgi:hypothetical protein